MKSTPRPPSAACAAARIWSGVGEVKTCPGQAASSIPWPTKPKCSGSCPLPPPEMSATFPALGKARVTYAGFSFTLTRSRCAWPNPRSASWTALAASLMNFFIGHPLLEQVRDPVCELPQQRLQRPLLARVAQLGHLEGNRLAAERWGIRLLPRFHRGGRIG